jgi:Holliday junction resolvasome RuvABC DNA-binding subunit
MIAFLRGRVLTTTSETVILDVNGVGYEAFCTGSVFRKITVGAVAELYTYCK